MASSVNKKPGVRHHLPVLDLLGVSHGQVEATFGLVEVVVLPRVGAAYVAPGVVRWQVFGRGASV
jgi:hypothetical protein